MSCYCIRKYRFSTWSSISWFMSRISARKHLSLLSMYTLLKITSQHHYTLSLATAMSSVHNTICETHVTSKHINASCIIQCFCQINIAIFTHVYKDAVARGETVKKMSWRHTYTSIESQQLTTEHRYKTNTQLYIILQLLAKQHIKLREPLTAILWCGATVC